MLSLGIFLGSFVRKGVKPTTSVILFDSPDERSNGAPHEIQILLYSPGDGGGDVALELHGEEMAFELGEERVNRVFRGGKLMCSGDR